MVTRLNPASVPPRRMGRPTKDSRKEGADTATLLLQAAAAEFFEHGYDDTDTNRIARRAGFAPQTFYRWYTGKLDAYIKVYQAWEEAEQSIIDSLLTERVPAHQIAERFVRSHQSFLTFRRSVRQVMLQEPAMRTARAASRQRQIAHILAHHPASANQAGMAAVLIQIERLSEALAEGEFNDLGIAEAPAYEALTALITQLRP